MKILVVPLLQLWICCASLCCSWRHLTGQCLTRWTTGLIPTSVYSAAFGFIITGYRSLTLFNAYILAMYFQGTKAVTVIVKMGKVVRCVSLKVHRHWILSCPEQITPDHRKSGEEHGINHISAPKPASLFPHLSIIPVCMHVLHPAQEWESQKVLSLTASLSHLQSKSPNQD